MNVILTVNGGMGKSVFATAVCKGIKRWHPDSKLIVISGYPEVFSGLPYVDMSFSHGQESYFYQKHVENQQVVVYANEPYLVTEHISASEHVIESWFRLIGIPYAGEMPEVSLNKRELMFYENAHPISKPILIMQTNGGPAGDSDLKYSWARDIPQNVVRAVIEEFSREYEIYHVRKDNQIGYENTKPIQDTYKAISYLIAKSSKRLFMDSFCQHVAAALNKPSTVLWVANKPKVFGYSTHENILANEETRKPDLRNSFLAKYNIAGALSEFPYNDEAEIFNVDSVIASIRRQ